MSSNEDSPILEEDSYLPDSEIDEDDKPRLSFWSRVKNSVSNKKRREILVNVIFTLALRFLISYLFGLLSPKLDTGILSNFIWALTTIFGIWFEKTYQVLRKD